MHKYQDGGDPSLTSAAHRPGSQHPLMLSKKSSMANMVEKLELLERRLAEQLEVGQSGRQPRLVHWLAGW